MDKFYELEPSNVRVQEPRGWQPRPPAGRAARTPEQLLRCRWSLQRRQRRDHRPVLRAIPENVKVRIVLDPSAIHVALFNGMKEIPHRRILIPGNCMKAAAVVHNADVVRIGPCGSCRPVHCGTAIARHHQGLGAEDEGSRVVGPELQEATCPVEGDLGESLSFRLCAETSADLNQQPRSLKVVRLELECLTEEPLRSGGRFGGVIRMLLWKDISF